MYRKEKCLSLLEDPEQDEEGSMTSDIEGKIQLKWHKVIIINVICLLLDVMA